MTYDISKNSQNSQPAFLSSTKKLKMFFLSILVMLLNPQSKSTTHWFNWHEQEESHHPCMFVQTCPKLDHVMHYSRIQNLSQSDSAIEVQV